MKKGRNKLSLFFAIIACICLAFAYGCGGKEQQSNVVLVDFEDKTETIDYGSEYELPFPVVFDAEGGEYKVEFEIKTDDGTIVRAYYNKITADIAIGNKYTLKCKAIITEKSSITRTITLEVVDTVKPTGELVNNLIGTVNTEYVMPTAVLSDNVPNTDLVVTSAVLKDSEGTEITITDGKFTPTAEGEYDYHVDFKDANGNTNYIDEKIYIRNEIEGRYVFEDFAHEYSAKAIKTVENGMSEIAPEYMESYDGKTGVVKVKSTVNLMGPKFYIKINRTYEQLVALNIEYINLRIKTVYTGTSEGIYRADAIPKSNFKLNTWVDLTITKADVENAGTYYTQLKSKRESAWEVFCRLATSAKGVALFNIYDADGAEENDKYTLYIDEISYQGVFTPEKQFADEYVLGDEVELKVSVFDLEDYNMKYTVISPDGETVAIDAENKFEVLQLGEYKVHAEIEHASESGSADFKFTVKSDNAVEIILPTYTTTYEIGDTVTIPSATCSDTSITVDYKIVDEAGTNEYLDIVNNEFEAEYYGVFTITYTAKVGKFIYAKVITLTVNGRPTGDMIYEDFGRPFGVKTVEQQGSVKFDKKWISQYEGEYGVIELTAKSAGTLSAYIEPINPVQQYEYLAIKMWLPNEITTPNKMLFGGYWGAYLMVSRDTTNERGRWVTYYLDAVNGRIDSSGNPVEDKNWFIRDFKNLRYYKNLTLHAYNCGVGAKIYIGDMFYTNGIETLGAEVSIASNVKQYNLITITSTKTEGIQNLKIVVENSKGLLTVLGEDGKYCPTETGLHKITVSAGNCREVYNTTFTVYTDTSVVGEQSQNDFFTSGSESGDEITAIVNSENDICESIAMNENASIKYGTNELGLRFELTLSKADYDFMKINYNDAEFGVFVIPVDYLTENALTIENLIGANSKYNWDETTVSGKKRIAKFSTNNLMLTSKGYYRFYGILSNLKDGTIDETNNLTREFCAVGYVKYVSGEETKYVFTENTAVSSLAYVAQKALEVENKQILIDKVINNVGKSTIGASTSKVVPNYSYKTEYYFEQTDGTYLVDEDETQTKIAAFNSEVNAVIKPFVGFYENAEVDGSYKTGKVLANGRLTLAVYYSLDSLIRLTAPLAEVDGKIDLTGCELYNCKNEVVVNDAEITATVKYCGKDVEVIDGKFEPKNTGFYEITYSCVYNSFEYLTIETFEKAYIEKVDEINSFDKAELVDLIKINNNQGSATWKTDMTKNGETKFGVADIKLTAGGDAKRFMFNLPHALDYYVGYDYVGITMCGTDDIALSYMDIAGPQDGTYRFKTYSSVKTKWTTVLFPLDLFLENYNANGTAKSGRNFRIDANSTDYHLYIADISMYSDEYVTLSTTHVKPEITTGKDLKVAIAEDITDFAFTENSYSVSPLITGATLSTKDTFFASQNKYACTFIKDEQFYLLLLPIKNIQAEDITTISYTTTDSLTVGTPIILEIVGAGFSHNSADRRFAAYSWTVYDPDGNKLTTATYDWPQYPKYRIKFTPTVAGTYKIGIKTSDFTFDGTYYMNVVVSE